MRRFEVVGIHHSVSGLWVVTYRERGNPFSRMRFYGPSYGLKDELDVYKYFLKETEHE